MTRGADSLNIYCHEERDVVLINPVELKNKKVTIFGMGVSGLSALALLKRVGANVSVVNQGEVSSWANLNEIKKYTDSCYSQEDSEPIFKNSDLIILSPGIPKDHPKLLNSKAPIWTEMELGFRFCDAPIIAITGTNGKTTTVTLLGEILNFLGYETFVGGNIGIPLCDYPLRGKKADFIVLEVSSFQLEAIKEFRPHIAAILNVTPNHGERYEKFEDYLKAKLNISKNMKSLDRFIITDEVPTNTSAFKIDLRNFEKMKSVWDLTNFKLQGSHNLKNLFVIYHILKKLDINIKEVNNHLSSLLGVSHRMELLKKSDPHIIFNDAKSTNWDATLTAIKSIDYENIYLILGGQKRGRGDSILPHLVEIKKNVKKVFLIGETTENLFKEINDENFAVKCFDLKTAINLSNKEKSGALIFSPAFPSFDQFKNYVERGNTFTKLIYS